MKRQEHPNVTRTALEEEDPLEYFKSLYLQDQLITKETRSQLHPHLDSFSDSSSSTVAAATCSPSTPIPQLQATQLTSTSPDNSTQCQTLVEHDDSKSTPESISEIQLDNDSTPPEIAPSSQP